MAETPEFHIRLWGVRGSIPCPGEETAKYGGNTSCVEIVCGDRLLIFDAGTGLCQFAENHLNGTPLDVDLFLTHTHYDHVWGWPHFSAALDERNKFLIRAGHLHDAGGIEKLMRGLLTDPLNPVHTGTLRAELAFIDFGIGDTLEPHAGIKVLTAPLNHPNGASGYRISLYNNPEVIREVSTPEPWNLEDAFAAMESSFRPTVEGRRAFGAPRKKK